MKVGDVIADRYAIEAHIGRGGMQDVYRAVDSLLEDRVALKTPQAGQAGRRFKQSAIVSARVNHHNVAKTYDYVEENGNVFLVEEFMPGETLEDKLSFFGILDPHLGARVLHHLAKGVAASHHAGVIHRDLKPSNVMIASGVSFDGLKITDFGIATLAESVFEEAAAAGDLTRSTSGTIRGALPYMAPEMMFREPGDHPGTAMDIWSIGAMLFRMLTGEYPFGVYLDAAVNVKNRTRKPWPNFMTANPQFSSLASELQAIVDSCLNYDPAERPSADDLTELCANLCYNMAQREVGNVSSLFQNGYSAWIAGPAGTVFCSMESVYGPNRPDATKNAKVCYSKFPGFPRSRAHPVLVVR